MSKIIFGRGKFERWLWIGGFHIVLVRVVNDVIYLTTRVCNRVMIRDCAQLQGLTDKEEMAASSETAVRAERLLPKRNEAYTESSLLFYALCNKL